jgi:Ca2+-binding RTX toxin-like protein
VKDFAIVGNGTGDVNGDGFGDLIVGTYFVGLSGESSGASYVVFGKASGFAAHVNLAAVNGANGFRILADSDYERAGRSVSGAGDLNGDGFGDLIVGAPAAAPHGEESGAAYVIYGYEPTTAVSRTGTDIGQTLAGGLRNDVLSALGGDDKLYGHDGDDRMSGGTGRDKMDGGAGNDSMSGGAGRDSMSAGSGDDVVSGDADNDDLGGAAGNDLLSGGPGADRMVGGDGNDSFNSGAGKDSMVGGAGADRFIFTAATWGGDYVSDFQDGLDLLRFKSSIADSVKDFAIVGNGTGDVTIAIGSQDLHLHAATRIFISDADFQFFV